MKRGRTATDGNLAALRAALIERLGIQADPPRLAALAAIENSSREDDWNFDHIVDVLHLDDPRTSLPFLRSMLAHKNPFVGLEAAALLAILGERSGLELLRGVTTMTNSQIEFFYAKVALLVLGEEIPESPEQHRSVFRDLEMLVKACSGG